MLIMLLALVMLFSTVLCGCGSQKDTGTSTDEVSAGESNDESKPAEKAKISFAYNWTGGDTKAPYFEGVINKFIEENKDTIEVNLLPTPGMDLENKIKIDAAANNLPDVFTYWLFPQMSQLVNADLVLDMNEYFNESKSVDKESFAAVLDGGSRDGKIYNVALTKWTGFLLANKRLFDKYGLEFPKTYEDLLKVSEVFNQNGIIPWSLTSKGGDPAHLPFSGLVYQFENGLEDSKNMSTTGKIKTPAFMSAAKYIEEFRKYKVIPSDTLGNGGDDAAVALYNEEKAAMVYTFPWMIEAIKDEIVDVTECIPVPKFPEATVDPATFTVGGLEMGVAINKSSFADSSKKDAIVKFVDMLLSDEMQNELAKSGAMPTKNIEIDDSGMPKLLGMVIKSTQNMDVLSAHEVNFPDTNSFQTFKDGIDALFAGAIDSEKFADDIEKALAKAVK